MIDGATGALDILQRMTNVSGAESAWCFWDRTLCKGRRLLRHPAQPEEPLPGEVGDRAADGVPSGGSTTATPPPPELKVLDGMLVARAQGREQKVGADSDAGWIAYMRGRLLFVKYYPYFPNGNYIDNGLSVAHYFNENWPSSSR